MEAKIQKWGNSEGIRIPNSIIKKMQLKTNDRVDIKQKGEQIIITKLNPKISLQERIDAYQGDNLCKEFVWDEVSGKEIW